MADLTFIAGISIKTSMKKMRILFMVDYYMFIYTTINRQSIDIQEP